jgi:hypothetical protein
VPAATVIAVPSGPAPIGSVWPVAVTRAVGPGSEGKVADAAETLAIVQLIAGICANATLPIAKIMPITNMGMKTRLNTI